MLPHKKIVIEFPDWESENLFCERIRKIFLTTENLFPNRIIKWDFDYDDKRLLGATFIIKRNFLGQ